MRAAPLAIYLRGKQKQEMRDVYIADLLWVIASGRRLKSEAKPYSEQLSSANLPRDNRSGKEILADVRENIRNRLKGKVVGE